MSLSTTRTAFGRTGSSPTRALLRRASTKAAASSSTQPPRFSLPKEKLRHLISLYHQSRTFVARDALDKRIDEAFVNTPAMASATQGQYRSYAELMTDARKRREQPAVRPQGRPAAGVGAAPTSSAGAPNPARAEAVFEALYGTSNGRNVGLELLLESWGSTAQRVKEMKREHRVEARAARDAAK